MTTSAKQTSLFGEDESTSLQEDFHANHTQWQGSDKAQKMLDISGRKCLEQLESAGRPGLWARTFLGLLIGQEGWFSSRCALTWKVKGTRYNRLYCQLQVSTLRTGEIGSGLLPTVTTQEPETITTELTESGRRKTKDGTDSHSLNLRRMATMGLLPTITASFGERGAKLDGTSNHDTERAWRKVDLNGLLKTTTAMDGMVTSGKSNPVSGNSGTLAQEIMSGYEPTMSKLFPTITASFGERGGMLNPESNHDTERAWYKLQQTGMLPTPAAQDSKNATLPISQMDRDTVPGAILRTGQTGQLSPHFVLEMMGLPTTHTQEPFQKMNIQWNEIY